MNLLLLIPAFIIGLPIVSTVLVLIDWRMWFARPTETKASTTIPSAA